MKKTLAANEVVADMNITPLIVSGGKRFVPPFNAREEQFLMMITERVIMKNN